MKRHITRHGWAAAWGIQIVEALILGALAALSLGLHPWAYNLMLWVIAPLLGALTAFQAVRRGLLNYAAWIAPPACMCVTHTLIWGYLPRAGAMLLCAFIALVGSAAGEVYMQQNGNIKRR